MSRLDDLELILRDYSDPSRLEERFRAWREYHDPDLLTIVMAAVAAGPHARVLEVGCGDGRFSEQIARELGSQVTALDFSPGMAARAALRGLDVQVGDIQSMPWPDASFDVVVANWMLYHVPDLDRGLAEIRRVLRPGGRLIASTMGHDHMRELWDLTDDSGTRPKLAFSAENGAEVLLHHFEDVDARPMPGHATFPDHAAAVRHIATSLTRGHLAGQVGVFDGPLRTTTTNCMFVASKA